MRAGSGAADGADGRRWRAEYVAKGLSWATADACPIVIGVTTTLPSANASTSDRLCGTSSRWWAKLRPLTTWVIAFMERKS